MDNAVVEELFLKEVTTSWQKVAFVVSSVLMEVMRSQPDIGDTNFHSILIGLSDKGVVEIAGDKNDMRASEVRLCT